MATRPLCTFRSAAFVAGCLAIIQCSPSGSSRLGAQRSGVLGEATVAIVQAAKASTAELTFDDVRALVRSAVSMAGGLKIKDGDTVVLKPNLVGIEDYTLGNWKGVPMPREFNGVTTDYKVTKAVVEMVRELDPTGAVYVMEGSAVSTTEAFAYFRYTSADIAGVTAFIALESASGGYLEFESPLLAKVVLPSSPTSPLPLLRDTYYLNRVYKEANYLISIPTLKNHFNAVVSGGIKNCGIGATPANIYAAPTNNNRTVGIDHSGLALHQHIHDWFLARPIDFVVIDGLQGIQNGPTPNRDYSGHASLSQDQMNMRLIVAGADAVAVDTVESLVVGWDPSSVEYLRLLAGDGVGQGDTSQIRVLGKRVDEVRRSFAGVTYAFAYGGRLIADTTAPVMSVLSHSQPSDSRLLLSLRADSSDLKRVEVHVGSMAMPAATGGFGDLSFDLSALPPTGVFDVVVDGYDAFLNRSRQVLVGAVTRGSVRCESKKLTVASALSSSVESAWYPASFAVDGTLSTRWSSAFSDPQWLQLDLGTRKHLSRVRFTWETAASKDYDVEVSGDALTWVRIAGSSQGGGGIESYDVQAAARYVRLFSRSRTTLYGISLWEVEVFGDDNVQCGAACTPSCAQRECGDDGCGGRCGACGTGQTCNVGGRCVGGGSVTLLAGSGVGSEGVRSEGAQQVVTGSGQTLCWRDVPVAGATAATALLGNGEAEGDHLYVLVNDVQVGDIVVPHTPSAWTPDTEARCALSIPPGISSGTVCLRGLGANWIASVGRLVLHSVTTCSPDCRDKDCGGDGCGGSCGTCDLPKVCQAHGRCGIASSTTLLAADATRSSGVLNEGAHQILTAAGQTLCWGNVSVAGIASATATLGNGEPQGDQLRVLLNDLPIGAIVVPHTTQAWMPDTAAKTALSLASGANSAGTLCLQGVGSNWIASVSKLVLESGAMCAPACGGKQCGPDGCGSFCGLCGAEQRCSADGLCVGTGRIELPLDSAIASAGVLHEGAKKVVTGAGQTLCWNNVLLTGVTSASVTVGNGEPEGDHLVLLFNSALIGDFAVPHTSNAWTPDTAAVTPVAATTGRGTLCLRGVGSNWIASVGKLLLESTP